jgi:hypothetical protein
MFLNNEDGMAETLRTLIILRAIYILVMTSLPILLSLLA